MKRMFTKSVLVLLVVSMFLCLLAACGGKDKPADTTEAGTEAATQPQTSEGTQAATDADTEAVTEAQPGDETGEEPGEETGEQPGDETAEQPGDETGKETGDETEVPSDEETTEEETEEPNEVIAVPEVDYTGQQFMLLMRNSPYYCSDLIVDSIAGDVTIVDRASFSRLKAIESETGIEVVLTKSSSDNLDTDEREHILEGDTTYDLIANHGRGMFSYATHGSMLNWYDVPFLSDCLGYEWWNQGMLNDFTVNGKVWVMSGDLSWQNLGATVSLVMNKEVCRKIGFDYPNDELVPDGEWTHEVFTEMVMEAKGDLDGDGTYTLDADMIGYTSTPFRGPLCILYSGGGSLVRNTGSEIELSVNDYPNQDIYDWYFGLFEEEHIIGRWPNYSVQGDLASFGNGQILFTDCRLYDIQYVNATGMSDYAVVPYPKWDESVDGYYTWCDAVGNCFGIPVSLASMNERLERNGVIMELFCRKGNESVIPAFYQRILLARYAQDKAGYAAMDLIKAGRRYDIACYMSGSSGLSSIANCGYDLAMNDEYGHNFATWYAARAEQAEEQVKKVNELFADLEFGF